jgi:hypothetical protein
MKYTISSQVVHYFQQDYLADNRTQAPANIQKNNKSETRKTNKGYTGQ